MVKVIHNINQADNRLHILDRHCIQRRVMIAQPRLRGLGVTSDNRILIYDRTTSALRQEVTVD